MSTAENLSVVFDSVPPRFDTVELSDLPYVEEHVPEHDSERVLGSIYIPGARSIRSFISKRSAQSNAPSSEIVDIHSVGLDIERLTATARLREGQAFRKVLRMGGVFNDFQTQEGPVAAEELAVSTLGLDASLYFHGTEQARRMNRHAILQQTVLQEVWEDIAAAYGPRSKAAARAYTDVKRQVPPLSPRDVKYGILCGYVHDYGEVAIGHDVPYEEKGDAALIEHETAQAIEFASKLHYPHNDSGRVSLLRMRIDSEHFFDRELNDLLRDEVGAYLHPVEITNAIYGTEKMHHGSVIRGEVFAATERTEYILSGLRAFDALEHNFEDIRSHTELAQGTLRLGVATIINSLEIMTEYASRYVATYDFLRQNSATLTRHIQNVVDCISGEQDVEDIYGFDPFEQYKTGGRWSHVLSYEDAQAQFMRVAAQWKKWNARSSLMKTLWENYIGTTHELTARPRDVSYLQYTSQLPIHELPDGRIIVRKPVIDMFGVGTDTESQEQHLELAA